MSAISQVHEQENWRQRLRAESAAAAVWREQWGFLEHTKPGGPHVDPQLPAPQMARTIAEQGILYPFLLQTYREQQEGGDTQTARYTIGGTAQAIAPPSGAAAYTSNSNAFTRALQLQQQQLHNKQLEQSQRAAAQFNSQQQQQQQQQHRAPRRQRQLGDPVPSASPTRTQRARHATRYDQAQHDAQRRQQMQQHQEHPLFQHPAGAAPIGSMPPLHLAPLDYTPVVLPQQHPPHPTSARPRTPLLSLDLATARTLMPCLVQDVGGCVQTSGVDPSTKYRHPLTTSHTIGWGAGKHTLEFFGVGQHSTRRPHGAD